MKRRRGNKKGRPPKKQKQIETNEVASNVVSVNTEENSVTNELDNEDIESAMDDAKAETSITTPSPSLANQPDAIDPVPCPIDKPFGQAVYTRVRVKIKTSKNVENQRNFTDAPVQNNTDKSSQEVNSEKLGGLNEKMEDSANSISEANGDSSGNVISKKLVGIKIISSKGLGSSGMSPCSNSEPVKGDKAETKDAELPNQESRYNERELKAALEVIRKVMKMDAAAPFNAPVNPVALGIPDYFDVIDTPMDFGTICSNLEKGVKYKNSEDVYKDVQYIWDNCLKYNNRGDYIVELAKHVRKSFTKYWTALGLFSDQPVETDSGESSQPKDLTPSNEGNTPSNGVILNLSGKKFHGLKKHKEGCQCAICVMMRRRQEREEIARLMDGHSEGSDDSLNDDVKKEGISHGESPFGEYTSSNMDNSSGADTDMERKGQEMKLGHIRNFYDQHSNSNGDGITFSGQDQRSVDGNGLLHYRALHIGSGTEKETPKQNGDGNTPIDQHNKPKELLDKNQRAKMLENLRYLENPMLLDLYSMLFSENSQSFWNGPHSLLGHRKGSTHKSSLHSAISSFMK